MTIELQNNKTIVCSEVQFFNVSTPHYHTPRTSSERQKQREHKPCRLREKYGSVHFYTFSLSNTMDMSEKQTYNKGIETITPINAKCVQLTRAARICLLFIMYLLGGITSPPRSRHPAHHCHCCPAVRCCLRLR